MVDRTVKQTAAKGGVSAAVLAARPFQCEWHEGCSKSFNRKSDLQRHYRIHTNERPYACDYKPCNKTFIQRSALTVHRRTHTGDKPHKCPFINCGKCFSDSSSLARHRRIHTNDKPYICRNQRCKKAFCRKTTMTKHIRKEHPAESIQDDQDAEYSDAEPSDDEQLENDAEDYQEDSRTSYQKPDNAQEMSSSRPSSNYHASLWRLPAQTAQRPSPLRLQRPYIPRSDTTIQEIKLERSSSATPQRSLTDPYPNGQMSTSEYVNARADTMPDSIPVHPSMPQSLANGGLPQQYQLGSRESNIRIWNSQQSMQESPTSLTGSSPSSAGVHSHSLFPSQSYQHQNVEVPSHEHIQYSQHTDVSVQSSIHQPMADMTVHEITLDQPQHSQYRNVSQTPVQQHPYDRVQRQTPQQNLYNDMTREPSQHPTYSETPPQAPVSHYQDDVPPTPAPSQQLPHYTTSMPETPYQQPQFLPLESFSISNQYFPPNGGAFQYNEALDWWKEVKPEEIWEQLPSQRLQGFEWQ